MKPTKSIKRGDEFFYKRKKIKVEEISSDGQSVTYYSSGKHRKVLTRFLVPVNIPNGQGDESISVLQLGPRVTKRLIKCGLTSLSKLHLMTRRDLAKITSINCARKIECALKQHRYFLRKNGAHKGYFLKLKELPVPVDAREISGLEEEEDPKKRDDPDEHGDRSIVIEIKVGKRVYAIIDDKINISRWLITGSEKHMIMSAMKDMILVLDINSHA
jgi:hypothetical protein